MADDLRIAGVRTMTESVEVLADKVRKRIRSAQSLVDGEAALDEILAYLAEVVEERDCYENWLNPDEPVCTKCGENHDHDESAMCEGGEVVTFGELPGFLLARLTEAKKNEAAAYKYEEWAVARLKEIEKERDRYRTALERISAETYREWAGEPGYLDWTRLVVEGALNPDDEL
jgi:hypothetical protein